MNDGELSLHEEIIDLNRERELLEDEFRSSARSISSLELEYSKLLMQRRNIEQELAEVKAEQKRVELENKQQQLMAEELEEHLLFLTTDAATRYQNMMNHHLRQTKSMSMQFKNEMRQKNERYVDERLNKPYPYSSCKSWEKEQLWR